MNKQNQAIKEAVRKNYAGVATGEKKSIFQSCCDTVNPDANQISQALGYSEADLNAVPEGANLGLGCGNPKAIANLKAGETVLDLGSGGGFDCFLASNEVGTTGHVIGVDMTPEMISKARNNAEKSGKENIEFRLGEIEHLPVADNSIDAIISNCVVNLSTDKEQVYKEAYRVLKQGGRIAISDVVASNTLPEEIKNDIQKYTACLAGASNIDDLNNMLKNSGFKNIRIQPKDESKKFIKHWAPDTNITDYILSATIEAEK